MVNENITENEQVEKVLEGLSELKQVVSSGFTVSGEYSSRKIDSRTTLELPATLNLEIVQVLKELQQILNTHTAAIAGYESQFIKEEDFYKLMVPSVFNLEQAKNRISTIAELKEQNKLTDLDKHYFPQIRYNYGIAMENITKFDLTTIANQMTNS